MSRYSLKWCGLAGMYALIAIGAYAAWTNKPIPAHVPPLRWKTYSEQAKDAYLENGHNVFVFVYAELSPGSQMALVRLDERQVAELFDYEDFVSLMLRYSSWNGKEIKNLWREFGHTKEPFFVVYKRGETPVQISPFSLEAF